MFSCRFLFLAIVVLLQQQLHTAMAEFGVPKEKPRDASVDGMGNIQMEEEDGGENPYAAMATRLQSFAPIDIQDAVDKDIYKKDGILCLAPRFKVNFY